MVSLPCISDINTEMLPRILENTFNHLLATDSRARERLVAFQGKSVGFNIKSAELSRGLELITAINSEGLTIRTGSVEQADCTISGTPIALIRYMNATRINPSTNHSLGVEIDGDLEFAREVSAVFRSLDVDWEEIFSRIVGDGPAHQLARMLSGFRSDIQKSKDSAKAHLHYLVTERMDQTVPMEEAQQFYDDVDQIVLDAAKLEQRINLLIESTKHG